jgi:hypothetical protein
MPTIKGIDLADAIHLDYRNSLFEESMMPSDVQSEHTVAPLSALDPGLPLLASEAAIELDDLLLGKAVDLRATRCLALRLETSTEKIGESSDRKSLMDPTTVSVFTSAMRASGLRSVHTLTELASEAWQISEKLKSTETDQNKEQLKRLRAFCIELARKTVAHEISACEMEMNGCDWS